MEEIRLINANALKEEAYKRFGLGAIKFMLLIDEQATAKNLPLHNGDDIKRDE